ncbi:alpha/beta hydrolase [Ornithinicoccus halotolerans]|uniref:alpha/beta hydrolase n=1 Tax=Ornithinicoccus halotolerans TaxID=1748220 RepID=UPI001885CF1D|nr:alpha/beta fold hydrolase [Ornithinicoccus halotolerans]
MAVPLRSVLAPLAVLLLLLLVLVLALWAGQRRLIFLPDGSPPGAVEQVLPGGREVPLTTADGLQLTAWYLPARGGPREDPPGDGQVSQAATAVLVAPGNAGHREARAPLAQALAERGLAVLLLDYRGYGGNPGAPDSGGVVADARAGLATLESLGHPRARTIYFGESIGTGVAAALAAEAPPAGLVLRSPFPRLRDLAQHHYPWLPVGLLLRERLQVSPHLRSLEAPVTVIYGDADEIVPPAMSAEVAAAAPTLHEEVVLPGVSHNDAVMVGPPVADAVRRLADHVGRVSGTG